MSSTIRAIPKHDINLIQSAQVITCLADAAKELLENAIDAGATKVSLKFTNHGLDSLEVIDDGSGIAEENYDAIVLKHATSKLSVFEDLERLSTLGFRGEALSSLCALSTLSITTCTKETFPRGTLLTFHREGTIRERKTVSATIGTIVRVENLFESLPVRRKDFSKNAKREILSTGKLLQAHAAIRVGIRIEAIHLTGKNRVHLLGNNGTTGSNDLRRNVSDLFGVQLYKILVPLDTTISFQSTQHRRQGETVVRIHGLLSHLQKEYGQRPERQLTYINSRPCGLPKVLRAVNEVCSTLGANRQPFVLLNLEMPPDAYDVNVSPDKRTIFLHDEQVILQHLRDAISNLFSNDSREIPLAQARLTKQVVSHVPPVAIDTPQEDSGKSEAEMEDSEVVAVEFPQSPGRDEVDQRDAAELPAEEDQSDEAEQQADDTYAEDHESDGRRSTPLVMSSSKSQSPSDLTVESDLISSQPTVFTVDSKPSVQSLTSYLKRKREYDNHRNENRTSRFKTVTPTHESGRLSEKDVPLSANDSEDDEEEVRDATETGAASIGTKEGAVDDFKLREERLERFTKRLQKLDKSSTSDHVHDLEVTMDTTGISFDKGQGDKDPVETFGKDLKDAGVFEAHDIAERTLSLNVTKSDFFDMKVIGQFNLGFILVLLGKELFIVDQHASDEKSNYERLLRETVIQSQKMAVPQELDLSAMERLSIDEHIETLSKNGFEVFSRGDNEEGLPKYYLDALPVTKKTVFGATDLIEILHLLMEGSPSDTVRCTKARRMFASRACRSSIMIGTALSMDKMQEIIWHLGEMDAPWNCPHGRPTMRHLMTMDDVPHFSDDC